MHAFWQGIYSFVHVLFRHVRSHWICWNFFPTNCVLQFLSHFSLDLSHILPVWRKSVVYQLYIFLRMTVKDQGHICAVIGKRFLPMGHFQLLSMILKFSMGHFLSFYIDFDGPFSKLMGLWRMAPCLLNYWIWLVSSPWQGDNLL